MGTWVRLPVKFQQQWLTQLQSSFFWEEKYSEFRKQKFPENENKNIFLFFFLPPRRGTYFTCHFGFKYSRLRENQKIHASNVFYRLSWNSYSKLHNSNNCLTQSLKFIRGMSHLPCSFLFGPTFFSQPCLFLKLSNTDKYHKRIICPYSQFSGSQKSLQTSAPLPDQTVQSHLSLQVGSGVDTAIPSFYPGEKAHQRVPVPSVTFPISM